MRLAYIISAYKLPDQLVRLVRKLDDEDSVFLIHVDAKTDEATFARAARPLTPLRNVQFVKRHRCDYGGFGHVRATLKGIDELVRHGLDFDYAILLTGQDFPLRSGTALADYFRAQRGRSFLAHFPLPTPEWANGGLQRIRSWHIRVGGRHLRVPARGTRLRRFPAGLRPFGGSSYWCLSRRCVEYVHDFVRREPSYVRFFKFVDVPDEMFFQTILLNSPLAETIVNDDLRYMEWRDPELAGGPAVLGGEDFDKIMCSGKLFARKFDTTQDSAILDLIDEATGTE